MAIIAGIYKGSMSDMPDYVGCSDSINISDKSLLTDEELEIAITSYYPESMRDSGFGVMTTLLSKEASQVSGNSNYIIECYNLDNLDEDMVYKVSSIYNIDYPLDYDTEQLKLLLKNYEKIRKERGVEKSLYMLFKILERSEKDLYQDDTDDTLVTKLDEGSYKVTNSRIRDTDFAKYMAEKVTRAGLGFLIIGGRTLKLTDSAGFCDSFNKSDFDSSLDDLNSLTDETIKTKQLRTDGFRVHGA